MPTPHFEACRRVAFTLLHTTIHTVDHHRLAQNFLILSQLCPHQTATFSPWLTPDFSGHFNVHINGITEYLSFGGWFVTWRSGGSSIWYPTSTFPSLFQTELRSTPWHTCRCICFIRVSADGYLGCTHILAVVNDGAVALGVQLPRGGIPGMHGHSLGWVGEGSRSGNTCVPGSSAPPSLYPHGQT